jgi:RNA polymerase sigma-70 factor (ECF subfamily)
MTRALATPLLNMTADSPDEAEDQTARRISAGVAAGGEAAFTELHARYAPRLRRLLLALSRGDHMLAGEVAQAAFLTAAAKLRRVESEAHLWHWLARVARQHLSKAWRRQQRDPAALPLDDIPEPAAERQAEDQLSAALDRAIARLETGEQDLLRLFYTERRPQQEIGAQLGLTAKAVAGRLDRLRERLRREIQEELGHAR